jgi:septation ring formation regulator EzrA
MKKEKEEIENYEAQLWQPKINQLYDYLEHYTKMYNEVEPEFKHIFKDLIADVEEQLGLKDDTENM